MGVDLYAIIQEKQKDNSYKTLMSIGDGRKWDIVNSFLSGDSMVYDLPLISKPGLPDNIQNVKKEEDPWITELLKDLTLSNEERGELMKNAQIPTYIDGHYVGSFNFGHCTLYDFIMTPIEIDNDTIMSRVSYDPELKQIMIDLKEEDSIDNVQGLLAFRECLNFIFDVDGYMVSEDDSWVKKPQDQYRIIFGYS